MNPSPNPDHPHPDAYDWAMMLALVLLWGLAFMMLKIAGETIPPMTAITGRVFGAGLLLWAAAALKGRPLPSLTDAPGRRLWRGYLIMGLVGNAIPFALILNAERTISSGVAGILIAFMPLATLLLAAALLKDEKLTFRKAFGFAVGFAGVGVLMGPAAFRALGGGETLAQASVLLAAIFYAVNVIITRKINLGDRWAAAAGINLAGGAGILIAALILERPWTITPSAASIAAVAAMAVGPSALATVFFLRVVKSAGSTFVSYSNYLVPPVATFAGALFLAESLDWAAFIALGLILLGLAIGQGRLNLRRVQTRMTPSR